MASKFGSPTYLTCDRPIATAAEARVVAAATAEEISSAFAEAEGTAVGDPRLKTGELVTIAGAGPFDGDWKVSHTRHRFDEDGYHTDFEMAGRQERSMLGLSSFGATGAGAAPIYGVVVGLVTNSKDPEKLGRVKLKFPWLSDDFESDWARVCFPGAGKERGFFVVPEVDDEVLVVFEHGDVRMPYVLGGLYNGKDKPPAVDYFDQADGKVKLRRWTSAKGHEITISDYDDEDHIVIKTKNNEYGIAISKSKDHVYVSSKGKIVLDGPGGIEIKGGDVTVTGGKIKLDASRGARDEGRLGQARGHGRDRRSRVRSSSSTERRRRTLTDATGRERGSTMGTSAAVLGDKITATCCGAPDPQPDVRRAAAGTPVPVRRGGHDAVRTEGADRRQAGGRRRARGD